MCLTVQLVDLSSLAKKAIELKVRHAEDRTVPPPAFHYQLYAPTSLQPIHFTEKRAQNSDVTVLKKLRNKHIDRAKLTDRSEMLPHMLC